MREGDLVGSGAEYAPELRPQVGFDAAHVGCDAGLGGAFVLEGETLLDVVDNRLGGGADAAGLKVEAAGRGRDFGAGAGDPGLLGCCLAGRSQSRFRLRAGCVLSARAIPPAEPGEPPNRHHRGQRQRPRRSAKKAASGDRLGPESR